MLTKNNAGFGRTWARRLVTGLSVGLLAAGCASTDQIIAGGRQISVVRSSSADLTVDKLWVTQEARGLVLKGYVLSSPDAPQDVSGHVDIVLRSIDGTILEVTPVEISAWKKQPRLRSQLASFEFVVVRLPETTRSIEVSPHAGPHPS